MTSVFYPRRAAAGAPPPHSPPPLQLVSSSGEYSDPGAAARSSYQLEPLLALVRGGGRKVDSRWSQVYDDVSV